MQFGEKVKQLREKSGMTQVELGNKIGVSDRIIGYYESNERFPRKQEIIVKLANYFNVTTDYLLQDIQANECIDTNGKMAADHILKDLEVLFAGGSLNDDDKDKVFRLITDLYFDAKQKNKEKSQH